MTKLRKKHPAKVGGLTKAARAALEEATLAELGKLEPKTPSQICIEHERGADGKLVKSIIKQAREALSGRVMAFVDDLSRASSIAADQGDAKPAIWALTNIAEKGERVVDGPNTQQQQPQLQLGIVIGGIPQQGFTATQSVRTLPPPVDGELVPPAASSPAQDTP